MSTVVSTVLSLSGWPAYAVIGLLAFAEAAAFVGLVLPGETALLLGGVLAATGRVSLPVLLLVAVGAAVSGDSVGYEVGRRGGSAVRRSRLGRRIGEERWTRAEQFVLRRGGPAVFLGRWVGVLRALVPALAGMTGMPYRRFLAWNLAGGVTWATTVVLTGYAAGAAWRTAAHYLSRAGLILAAVAVLAALGWWLVRHRKRSTDSGSLRSRLASAAHRLDGIDGLLVTVGVLVAGAATFVFAALSEGVMEGGEVTSPDRPVLDWLIAHRTGGLTAVLRVVTDVGGMAVLTIVGLLVAGAVARQTRSWRPVAFLATTAVGSSLLTVAAKTVVGRSRPPATTALIAADGFAFPSGHALNTAAVVGACAVVLWTYRQARVWTTTGAVVVVVVVGFSRLYLGVDWLTDVLAGYALGIGWLAAVAAAFHLTRPEPIEPPQIEQAPSTEELHRVPSRS